MIRYFEDNDDVIFNPGMGWVMHTSIEKGYVDHNECIDHEQIQVVALLSSWSKIEVDDNQFDFKDLDDAVQRWTSLGKQIHLRISTDPMIYRDSAAGVPDWLFDKYHVPYQEKMIYGLKAKFPDYLNSVYLEKVFRFVDILTTRYHHQKNIVLMDLRGYGEWGEWHSGYMHDDVETHVYALRQVIKTWDDACGGRIPLAISASYEWRRDQKLPLFAPQNVEEYMYFSAFDSALNKSKRITLRRDGIGGALKYYDYTLFQKYFYEHHHHPLTTEFFIAYDRQKENIDGVRGYYAEDAVEEALSLHPNYMMLMWDSCSFIHERKDLIHHGLKRMGYRFIPSRVEIYEGENVLKIQHHWINRAVGRLYQMHHMVFKITLIDQSVLEYRDYEVNLHGVIEGQPKTFVTLIPKKQQLDIIKLEVGVYLEQDQCWMKIPLQQENQGFYVLYHA